MFHRPLDASYVRNDDASYVRNDGARMVPDGGPGRYVNEALQGVGPDGRVRQSYGNAEPGGEILELQRVRRPLRDLGICVCDFWRPASGLKTNNRFACEELTPWPADVRITVGPTVWLDGALLLVVTQAGYGIIRGKRYAKLKMRGVPLATPQPAPLSHTLWDDIATVKTKSDLKVVNHSDDAALDSRTDGLKEAEKAAAKRGSVVWKPPTAGVAKQQRGRFERLDWDVAFSARKSAGGDHPLCCAWFAVRQPGEGAYSPIWYRKRHWCEGDPEGQPSGIVYLGSAGDRECPPGKYANKWPFAYMRTRGVGQDLFDVGIVHFNYWATSMETGRMIGLSFAGQSHFYASRTMARRAVYKGAVAALKDRSRTTGKPVAEVVERVVIDKASIANIRYLSRHKNNSIASSDLMAVLCDGLKVLEEYYQLAGDGKETGWRAGDWADTTYIDQDGFEVDVVPAAWPQRWTRFLREFKYREEQETRESRAALRL